MRARRLHLEASDLRLLKLLALCRGLSRRLSHSWPAVSPRARDLRPVRPPPLPLRVEEGLVRGPGRHAGTDPPNHHRRCRGPGRSVRGRRWVRGHGPDDDGRLPRPGACPTSGLAAVRVTSTARLEHMFGMLLCTLQGISLEVHRPLCVWNFNRTGNAIQQLMRLLYLPLAAGHCVVRRGEPCFEARSPPRYEPSHTHGQGSERGRPVGPHALQGGQRSGGHQRGHRN